MGELHAASRYIGLIALSAAVLEALLLKFVFKRSYDWRSGLASMAVAVVRSVNLLLPVAVALPGAYWLQRAAAGKQQAPVAQEPVPATAA